MESSRLWRDNDLKDLTMNPKDVVFKIFFKRSDGTRFEYLEIYRDGTWKDLKPLTDSKSVAWHNLMEDVRRSSLKRYKEDARENWHSDAALPQFYAAHKEDREAYTTLCAVCQQPTSLDLENCIDDYAVQYFGEGAPWKESKLWKQVASGEVIL